MKTSVPARRLLMALALFAQSVAVACAQPAPDKRVAVAVLLFAERNLPAAEGYRRYFYTIWTTGELREIRRLRLAPYRAVEYIYRRRKLTPGVALSAPQAQNFGKQLGVEWTAQGEYGKTGANWTATARLVRTADGRTVSTEKVQATDPIALCDQIALQLAKALQVAPTAEERKRMQWQATRSPIALARYSRALTPGFMQRPLPEQEAALRETIEADPNFASALRYLASILHKRRQPSLAEEAVRRALKIRPEDPSGHRVLGDIFAGQGRFAEAEKAYREALRLNPEDTACLTALATLLQTTNRLEEAIQLGERAGSLDPTDAAPRTLLANLYTRRAKIEKALALAQEAVRLEPEDVPALFTLGMVSEMGGEEAQAIQAYQKCLALLQRPGASAEMRPIIEERLRFLQSPKPPDSPP